MSERFSMSMQRIERIAPGIFLFVLPFTHTTPLRLLCLALSLIILVASVALKGTRRAHFVAPPPFVSVNKSGRFSSVRKRACSVRHLAISA